MTETELEQIKLNARILALETVLAAVLRTLGSAPAVRQSLLEGLDRLAETSGRIPVRIPNPEYAALASAELQEATESLVSYLKSLLNR